MRSGPSRASRELENQLRCVALSRLRRFSPESAQSAARTAAPLTRRVPRRTGLASSGARSSDRAASVAVGRRAAVGSITRVEELRRTCSKRAALHTCVAAPPSGGGPTSASCGGDDGRRCWTGPRGPRGRLRSALRRIGASELPFSARRQLVHSGGQDTRRAHPHPAVGVTSDAGVGEPRRVPEEVVLACRRPTEFRSRRQWPRLPAPGQHRRHLV